MFLKSIGVNALSDVTGERKVLNMRTSLAHVAEEVKRDVDHCEAAGVSGIELGVSVDEYSQKEWYNVVYYIKRNVRFDWVKLKNDEKEEIINVLKSKGIKMITETNWGNMKFLSCKTLTQVSEGMKKYAETGVCVVSAYTRTDIKTMSFQYHVFFC